MELQRSTPVLLTIGYQQRDLPALIALLREARVGALVDVRETAWSRKPGFTRQALAEGLGTAGIEYLHARFAGNPKALRKSKDGHAGILARYAGHLDEHPDVEHALDRLIAELSARGLRACLLCFERHPGDCHRGVLAGRWAARTGGRVEHLGPDGCPRLAGAPLLWDP